MSNKFCVSILNSKKNTDAVTVGFVVASAALGSEKETMVFLSTDGVYAAVKDEYNKIDIGGPFSPLKELVDNFMENGGKIWVCGTCLKLRGIAEDQLIDGAIAAGAASLVDFLSDGTACITY